MPCGWRWKSSFCQKSRIWCAKPDASGIALERLGPSEYRIRRFSRTDRHGRAMFPAIDTRRSTLMRKPTTLVLLGALIYGGYWFLQKYQVDGLDKISFTPRTKAIATGYDGGLASNVPVRAAGSVRIASF